MNYYHTFLTITNVKSSSAGEDVEKLDYSYISSGHVTPYSHYVK